MREPGNETLFSPERKKVSVKVNGKDEGAEGRRRLSGGSYGGGKAAVANNHISSMGARLKGGCTMQSRHHSHSLLPENSVTKEIVVAEGEFLNKKRTAEEEGVLPQWGHGKRSRCSRFEPSKHASPVTGLASKSAPRSEKTPHPPAPKLRGPPKLTSNKTLSNGFLPRNNPINRIANGFTHNSNSSMPSFSLRQNGGEARESVTQKERVPKNASADHRRLQGSDGSELATTTQVHVHCNGHTTKTVNNNKTNNSNGNCNGHINKINNNNNVTSVLSPEPTSLAKPRLDLQTLEWPRIVIALTRKEKEDDFFILKGTKLPQRPKKRPKVVEKVLHYCTPGNWLSDLSRGRYDVREKKSGKKKPRGLKAMESLESNSE